MLTTIVVSNKKPPLLSVSESGGSTSLQISKDTDETLDMEKGWCEAHDLVCDFLDELGYHEEANIFRDLMALCQMLGYHKDRWIFPSIFFYLPAPT